MDRLPMAEIDDWITPEEPVTAPAPVPTQPAPLTAKATAPPAEVDDWIDPSAAPVNRDVSAPDHYTQQTGGNYEQDKGAQFLQGLTSWSDEGLAALRSLPKAITSDKKFWDIYNAQVAQERANLARYEGYDPDSAQKLRVAGMATSVAGPGALFKTLKALGMGTKTALSLLGFTGGGVYGAGTAAPAADTPMGDALGERLEAAKMPAVFGGIAAPLAGLAGEKLLGPAVTAAKKGYDAVRRPLNSAYEKVANQLGGTPGIDKFATDVATGATNKNADIQRRAFDILGEEMQNAGGNAAVAEANTVKRLMAEHDIAQSTAIQNLRSIKGVHKDSNLFFGEYPAVAESNAATRMTRTNHDLQKVGQIDDSPVHSNIDLTANSGQGQSVADVRNAVLHRQAGAAADTKTNIQKLSPQGRTIEDVEQMIEQMKGVAKAEYDKVYDPANGLIDQKVLLDELSRVIRQHEGNWALRGGEQKAALKSALDEFYITDPTSGTQVVMPTLQMAQDMRGALRGIIQRNVQAGNNHIVQALQPLYDDVTKAMQKASPAWEVANARWAEKAFADKASELGEAFSTTAGPKFREQLAEFHRLAPEMQDVVRVHYLQKLLDKIDSGVGKTHDVAKLFDRQHYTNAIMEMFGPDAARDWTRMLRDLQVQTKSRNMLQNSATHRRGEAQLADDAESGIGVVSAVDNASIGSIRGWLMDNLRHFIRERRNRALNEVMTTPVKDTAKAAQHVQEMRNATQRVENYKGMPGRIGERLGKGAGFVAGRTATERQRETLPHWMGGPALPEAQDDEDDFDGEASDAMAPRGLGVPRKAEGGGLGYAEMLAEKLTNPLDEDFSENVEGSMHSALSPEGDYYGEHFGPEIGRYAQDVMDAGEIAEPIAKGMSGLAIPEAVGEGRYGDAALNAGLFAAGPIAKGLGAAGSAIGAGIRANPVKSVGVLGGLGLGASASTAGDPNAGAPKEAPMGEALGVQLAAARKAKAENMAARQMLGQQRDDNLKGKTGSKKAGPGPISRGQDAEMQKLIEEGERIDMQIAKLMRQQDPQYVEGMGKVHEAEAERQKMLDAEREGWGHDYGTQTASNLWSVAPIAAGLGTAALMRVPPAVSSRLANRRWWNAVRQAEDTALPKGERAAGLGKALEYDSAIPKKSFIENVGSHAGSYVAPGALGAAEGAALSNAPEAWNTFLPQHNQEREAYEEYLKRMPAGFPEAQGDIDKAEAHLKTLPETNETRDRAMQHFQSGDYITRGKVGAMEGAAGAFLGTTMSKPIAPGERAMPRPETNYLRSTLPTEAGLGRGLKGPDGLGAAGSLPPSGGPQLGGPSPTGSAPPGPGAGSPSAKALPPPTAPGTGAATGDVPALPTAAKTGKASDTPLLGTDTANAPGKKVKRRSDLQWSPGGGKRNEEAWSPGGGRWRKKAKEAEKAKVEKIAQEPLPNDVLAPADAEKIIAKAKSDPRVRAKYDAGDANGIAAVLSEGSGIPAHRLLDAVLKAMKAGKFD
jgi:hypothetical protein